MEDKMTLLERLCLEHFHLLDGKLTLPVYASDCLNLKAGSGTLYWKMRYARLIAALSGYSVGFEFNEVWHEVPPPDYKFDALNTVEVFIAENEDNLAMAKRNYEEAMVAFAKQAELLAEIKEEIQRREGK